MVLLDIFVLDNIFIALFVNYERFRLFDTFCQYLYPKPNNYHITYPLSICDLYKIAIFC